MKSVIEKSLVGTGIYSVAEASKLTDVSPGRIRRWLRGYRFRVRDSVRESPRVFEGQLPEIDGELALSFLDLQEIRIVDAFLSAGVTWKSIRKASSNAAKQFATSHPFCLKRFQTDGRGVFAELGGEKGAERALIDLTENQFAFKRIVTPYLRDVEYAESEIVRWWPLGVRRDVVVDPTRSFGQPIISEAGVPTAILALTMKREGSVARVAKWFDVSPRAVKSAIEFEERIAA